MLYYRRTGTSVYSKLTIPLKWLYIVYSIYAFYIGNLGSGRGAVYYAARQGDCIAGVSCRSF